MYRAARWEHTEQKKKTDALFCGPSLSTKGRTVMLN